MVADLDLPLRILGGATVREPDGLAMSSRNRFLSPAERALAPRLAQEMQQAAAAMLGGTAVAGALAAARAALAAAGFAVDYLALVEAETLREATSPPGRLIAAAKLGGVRLLDNIAVG
jgi:pantoate--beta-alanine ligase